jgi:hypothetical protein
MTQEHPITPPPELVEQWMQVHTTKYDLARQAVQWGADQELEACLNCMNEWGAIHNSFGGELADELRAARRPKPPSLKEQALSALENLNGECLLEGFECPEKMATIRRALEQLPDNE